MKSVKIYCNVLSVFGSNCIESIDLYLNLLEMRLWVFLLCLGFSVLDSTITRQVYYNQGNCGYPGTGVYRRTGAGIEESR